MVPHAVARRVNQAKSKMTEFRSLYAPVIERSGLDNIYHCTFHKAGSQWVQSMLTDLTTFRYCGLSHYHLQSRMMRGSDERELRDKTFEKAFPIGNIVSPLYITVDNFKQLPKPDNYRAFFMMRDPRDMMISWYYSTLHSHIAEKDSPMARRRQDLQALTEEEGIRYAIDHWNTVGIFDESLAWKLYADEDSRVRLLHYKDVVGPDKLGAFGTLFVHLDIRMPDDVLAELVEAYSFKRLSGRQGGQTDKKSHLRTGKTGDWHNYFTDSVKAYFLEKNEGTIEALGYTW